MLKNKEFSDDFMPFETRLVIRIWKFVRVHRSHFFKFSFRRVEK